jgi:hypothetical protein
MTPNYKDEAMHAFAQKFFKKLKVIDLDKVNIDLNGDEEYLAKLALEKEYMEDLKGQYNNEPK